MSKRITQDMRYRQKRSHREDQKRSTIHTASALLPILEYSSLHTKIAPIIYLCAPLTGALLKKNLPLFLLPALYNMFDNPTNENLTYGTQKAGLHKQSGFYVKQVTGLLPAPHR